MARMEPSTFLLIVAIVAVLSNAMNIIEKTGKAAVFFKKI
jgi:hypothetical protein